MLTTHAGIRSAKHSCTLTTSDRMAVALKDRLSMFTVRSAIRSRDIRAIPAATAISIREHR